MKKISDLIRHALQWEFSVERVQGATGLRILTDRVPGERMRLGFGGVAICVSRSEHATGWAARLHANLPFGVDVRMPFSPWVLSLLRPSDKNQHGLWIDRWNSRATLVGLGRAVLCVERQGTNVPLLQLAY